MLDILGFELRSHLLTQLRRIDGTHVMLAKGQMHQMLAIVLLTHQQSKQAEKSEANRSND